jgi:N4-gp56 family major capsid protein|tara:strand:- start:20405 stop:21334 length:930 start_codon:yes stop_codon:yes gene_type:complete
MALTGTGQVSSSTGAFEQVAYFALRSNPLYEMIADVRSTAQTHNGASVTFDIYNNMTAVTAPIAQAVDIAAVQLGDTTVTVTLQEHGNAATTTAKLRGTSFLNVDADSANIIGYNMVDSLDQVVAAVAAGGSNDILPVGRAATVNIIAGDTITADQTRTAAAKLRTASAPGWENGNYIGMIHPNVAFDLRSEAAVTDVIAFQIRQDAAAVRNGSIGTWGGVEFIENPRANIQTGAGAAGIDVYDTVIAGRQGLAKGFSRAAGFGEQPQIVYGPIVDSLRRFITVGWYHLVGYERFREECLQRVESSSSL